MSKTGGVAVILENKRAETQQRRVRNASRTTGSHSDQAVSLQAPVEKQAEAPVHFLPDLSGEYYLGFIKSLHEKLSPETYLEIGSRSGDSLALANCSSIAIDPVFALKVDVVGKKPLCLIYQGTSDDYFKCQDPTRVFGKGIDFAFLDGLHWFEFLLRDFINTERFCGSRSVVAMHDCIPTDVYVAERVDDPVRRGEVGSKPTWWAGDVWKIVPVLKKWRPDLKIIGVDCAPTGLILVSGLDAQSTVLLSNYHAILEEFAAIDLADYGLERLHAEIDVRPAREMRLEFDRQ